MFMKYRVIISLFVLLLFPLISSAERVSETEARAKAAGFLSRKSTKSSDAADIKLLGTGDEGLFYIFGRECGGFVIVSSDTSTEDILAYSPEGNFDTGSMSDAQEAWMRNLASHVRRASELGLSRHAAKKGLTEGKVLETANWNQLSPFNDKCPEYAPAGCTAVAMAIALRYINWPDAGTGTVPSYSYEDIHAKKHTVDSLRLGHSYNWDKMPLTGVTKDNVDDIATLIRDCAIIVQSLFSYDDNGTSAFAQDILPALKKHMKYDAGGTLRYSRHSSAREWISDVISEIDANRPVIYNGYSEKTGHSFVVDGYDADGRFHINWGWGGSGNGYFSFPDLGEYSEEHNAVFGLMKEQGGLQADRILVSDISCSTTTFAKGEAFTSSFTMHNISDSEFTGSAAIGRMNDDFILEEIISDELTAPEKVLNPYEGCSFSNVRCLINGDIKVGDMVTLFFKDRSGDWKQASYDVSDPLSALIFISDPIHLDAATSLKFNKTSRKLTLSTKSGATCFATPELAIKKLDDSTFELEGFSGGSYSITLELQGETCSFEIVL